MKSNLIKNTRMLKGVLVFATILMLIGALVFVAGCDNKKTVNILDMGAKAGDSAFDNSGAIQEAINQMSEAGGGRVTIPAGEFYTHPIELKSGVELHLEDEAKLLGVADKSAYKKFTYKKFSALI